MKSKHQIYENAIKKKIFTLNRYKARTGYLFKQLVIKENVLCIKWCNTQAYLISPGSITFSILHCTYATTLQGKMYM